MTRYDIAKGVKPKPIKAPNSFEDSSTECSISMVKKETMSVRGLSFRCELLKLSLKLDLKKFSYDMNMEVKGPHDLFIEPNNPFLMTVHGQEFTIIPTSAINLAGITHVYGWTEGCKFKRIKGVRENLTRPGAALGIRGSRRVRRGPVGMTGIYGTRDG
jgi:hypothetical protein